MLSPQELEAHIKTNLWKMYSGEMNELIQVLYTTAQLAFQLDTRKLVISPAQVIHLDKNGQVLFKLHSDTLASEFIKSKTMQSNYMEVFRLILLKDKLVSEHFELSITSPEQVVYIIKNS